MTASATPKPEKKPRPPNPPCQRERCHHPATFHTKDEPHGCRAFGCNCEGYIADGE